MTPPGSLSSRLRHAGILPTDSEELQLQKTLLIFATGLISFASMFWLFIYWQLGPQISSTIPFVFQLLLIANLALYLKTLNFELFRQTQLALFLFMPFVAQWSMGNFITASGVSLWALLAPVGAVLVIGAREALKAAYGKAITAVPGKSEGWLMCPFEDDMPIYFGGSDDAPAAYVEVNVFGRSVPGSAWEKLTKSIMAALNSELGIPEDRTYIRYTATTDWGWNGGNF